MISLKLRSLWDVINVLPLKVLIETRDGFGFCPTLGTVKCAAPSKESNSNNETKLKILYVGMERRFGI